MYTGVITEIKWERVFLTLKGTVSEVTSENEMKEIFKMRHPSFFPTPDMDAKEAKQTHERLEHYYMRINSLKSLIENYDENKPYFILHDSTYSFTYFVEPERDEDGNFTLTFNVTNFRDRAPLQDATYQLSIFHKGENHSLNCAISVARERENLSRLFLFDKNSQCYTLSFGTTSNELDPVFELKSFLFSRKRKRAFDLKRIFRETRDKIIKTGIKGYYNLLYYIVPKRGKRILLATEARGTLQGNLLAIYNRLIQRGLDKDFKILMSFRKVAGGHGSAFSWFKVITYMAISDYILIDDYAPLLNWLWLKDKTKLIQVWHAGVGFKSVGFCRFGANGTPILYNGHRQYDYALTGSTDLKHVYSEVFGIEEDAVLPTGLPRIDELLDEEQNESFREEFYQKYPDFKNKKIILFAPTFRGTGQKNAHYPYNLLDMNRLYNMCGDTYVFLFKMHPFILEEPNIKPEYRKRIYNFSDFKDVNKLLQVTDLLITDYSSIIYEYSLLRRPMLFFAYDKEAYSVIRGFHNDYDEFAPGKICVTLDEMISSIENEDFQIEKVDAFVERNFDHLDTHSSDRVIDEILLNRK